MQVHPWLENWDPTCHTAKKKKKRKGKGILRYFASNPAITGVDRFLIQAAWRWVASCEPLQFHLSSETVFWNALGGREPRGKTHSLRVRFVYLESSLDLDSQAKEHVDLDFIVHFGKNWRQQEKGWQRMSWLESISDTMDVNLSKLQEIVCAFLVAQLVKNLPAIQETWFWSLGRDNPPGEGNDYPLQYSCLEDSKDRGT